MGENNNQEEIEINLWELIGALWSKAGIIILSGILLGLLVLAGTKLWITPQYESETKMYILSKQNDTGLTQSDMQTSTFLTKDYVELIKSRTVTEEVIAQLGLNLTNAELLGKIIIEIPADTRVVKIRAKDPDPYVAAEIANAIRDVSGIHIQRVMNIEAVNVVELANVPESVSSPNSIKNAVMGGAFGVFLACGLVIIIHLINDTIKTSEDIEKYLDISVLGSIPVTEGQKNKRKRRKERKRRKRKKR
jgi:Capsular polysaccharide biosynthesis protein